LPRDLPHEIKVDLSVLKNLDDVIAVKDLAVVAGVEILDDAEESVVVATPPREEEVEAAAPVSEAEAVEGVEVTTAKTEEGEEEVEKSAE
ncbi:MAG: 50S ribosomal protein L25, partial [bacterium]